MGRAILTLAVALALLLSGCGGEGDEPGSAVPCDDVAFRAQDEELYVTQATVSNAIGGGGDPATLLLDLRRGRAALSDYLDAHPPCSDSLREVEVTERGAIAALDEAIAALDEGGSGAEQLASALESLTAAQSGLGGTAP